MTAALICQLDQVEPAAFIIGHVETGSQVFVCEECFVPWALTMLKERLGPQGNAMLRDHFAEAAAAAEPSSISTPAPSPKRRGRHSPAGTAEAPPAPPDPSSAAPERG